MKYCRCWLKFEISTEEQWQTKTGNVLVQKEVPRHSPQGWRQKEIVSLPSLPYLRINGLDSQNPLILVYASNLDLKLIEIRGSFMVSRPKMAKKSLVPLVSSGMWQLRTPREAGPARHQELGVPAFHRVQKIGLLS
jgi:hypothetical protein